MSKKGGPGDDDPNASKAAAKGDCFEHDDEEHHEGHAEEDHGAGTAAEGNHRHRDDGSSNGTGPNGNDNGPSGGNGGGNNGSSARHPQRGGDTRHPLGASDESLAGWFSAGSSTIDLSAAGRTMSSADGRSLAAASAFGAASSSAGGSSSRQPSRPGAYAMTPTPLATALRRSSNEFGNIGSAAPGRRRRGRGQGGANGNANGNESDDDDDDDDDGSSVHYAVGMTVPVAPPEESNGDDGTARSGRQQHRGSESLPSMSTYAIAEPMSIGPGSSMPGAQGGEDSARDGADGDGRKSSASASSSLRRLCVPLLLILALVGIVVGVTVPLVSSRGTGTTAGGTNADAPTITPGAGTEATEEATGEFETYVQSLLDPFYRAARAGNGTSEEDDNAFGDPTSPQSLALEWVVSQDAYSRSAYRRYYVDGADPVDGNVSGERDCPTEEEGEELGQIILQRYVLAVMYYSTDGANWDDSLGFLSADTPECSWNVYDNATETLVGVADCAVDMNAGAAVPADPCTQGTDHAYRPITSLVLARNGLLGTIPSELGLLSGLKVLDFSSNGLESTIPSQLALISPTLEKLDMSENGLVGSIPRELFVGASMLQEVELWGNDFTGRLPSTLGDCTSLKSLGFARNQISGPIPTEIGKLANLESLIFWRNKVTGSIPTELGNCQSLHTYSAPFNQMAGPFPTELGQLANLTTVFAYENMHSGQIPSELGNLPKLEVFNVAINKLSGTLPTEIGQISSLRRFRYFENIGISGTVPSEITSLPLLEDVWMTNTQLGGPFPSVFHPESRIGSISAENSAFTGTVPMEIWSMPNLVDVKIINTTMAGSPIPDVLPEGNNAGQMLDLVFSGNTFSGTLPSSIGSFQGLTKLLLQDNAFSGDVPSELSSLESLVELQIQGNDFDSVPSNMCDMRDDSENGDGVLEVYVSDCEEVGCTCCTECL